MYEYNGEYYDISGLMQFSVVSKNTLRGRLNMNWEVEKALKTEIVKGKRASGGVVTAHSVNKDREMKIKSDLKKKKEYQCRAVVFGGFNTGSR